MQEKTTMLEKVESILEQANPDYKVIYEENHMMNLKADDLDREQNFVHIEEFLSGQFVNDRYRRFRVMRMLISFSKFVEMHEDAIERQKLRDQIEEEIVVKFMDKYEASGLFGEVDRWMLHYPPTRWDGNEVSVMLEFQCKLLIC